MVENGARRSLLRHVHYIASVEAEPPCGDRVGSVTMNPANVGCLRCLAFLANGGE